jgi:hypothetical protein
VRVRVGVSQRAYFYVTYVYMENDGEGGNTIGAPGGSFMFDFRNPRWPAPAPFSRPHSAVVVYKYAIDEEGG